MNRLGQIRLPPLSAAVNVASQIRRQIIPNRSEDAVIRAPGERVRFAQLPDQNHTSHGGTDEHHEMSNMKSTNPFLTEQNNYQNQAEDSFNEGYQRQQSRVSSVDFSEGSDFVEGKSEVKINEYQAAWNVTNAIQVICLI
ncbi:hypothetical protein NQ314_019282 [Rhamnusium bicolor]|uniref:Uncharacterized protein n=1 Tax=Rhamnusium bicolor TaxID=1586634 RepID=A0AAV8WPE7_9CUCU|nr:hypothetical protein NQ314_019282 [Rhamnusium bicolor]